MTGSNFNSDSTGLKNKLGKPERMMAHERLQNWDNIQFLKTLFNNHIAVTQILG